MVQITRENGKVIFNSREARRKAKEDARKARMWAQHTVRKDAHDFIHFWFWELVLLIGLNFHTGHVVSQLASSITKLWPW